MALNSLPALIEFCANEYGVGDLAIEIAADFYTELFATAKKVRPPLPERPERPHLVLEPGVHLVKCRGNINALFTALRERVKPNLAAVACPVTVAVRRLPYNRSMILEFPPISLDILRHAERYSAIEEIAEDFRKHQVSVEDFSPEQILDAGISLLQKKKLVTTIPAHTNPKTDALSLAAPV